MKLVVWWCIPCKGILPIFREFSANFGTVRFIVEKENSENREKLGWEPEKETGHFEIETLDHHNWEDTVNKIILEEKNSIHIFNGIRTFPKVFFALQKACNLKLKYGILAEAPHNPYTGIKRFIKGIYSNFITPIITERYSNHADFYFSASGEATNEIKKLGWSEKKIFPFGYFTEFIDQHMLKDEGQVLNIICTGYITKNKGHILLMKALKSIGDEITNVRCRITGFGPERENLEKYVLENRIQNVSFLGVVKTHELIKLLKSSDVLVAPGFVEPWGIRINEAIMYGLPSIVSNGIGASQVVQDLECGLIFRSGSADELAQCLLSYINNPDLLNKHKRNTINAKNKISPYNAAKYMNDALASIYNSKDFTKTKPWLYK